MVGRIFLTEPHMGGGELDFIHEADYSGSN